jgi:UDP-N-acetylglucosamine 2-epimerase (non-hydrolysing)
MRFIHIVGARPNFMKAAPVMNAFAKREAWQQYLIHTGQHYDQNMSDIFFGELGLPKPDVNLDVGSASHAVQTAEVMIRFEELVFVDRPDWVLVYGDVNSTMAVAVVCAKLHIPVAHVEAGLRSSDRRMPEEINRLVTDHVASLLLTPSQDGNKNLYREGIDPARVHLVGNVMIDTLIRLKPKAKQRWAHWQQTLDLHQGNFVLVTLHRPSNVDDPIHLENLMQTITEISTRVPVVFPVHPRTHQRLQQLSLPLDQPDLHLIEPVGYLDFLCLQMTARMVITDSGGVQEETTFLGVPCLTMRENTERPVTIDEGTNVLIGRDLQRLRDEVDKILNGREKQGRIPEFWDGHTSERIASLFESLDLEADQVPIQERPE